MIFDERGQRRKKKRPVLLPSTPLGLAKRTRGGGGGARRVPVAVLERLVEAVAR